MQTPDAPTLPPRARPGGQTTESGAFYPGGAFMPQDRASLPGGRPAARAARQEAPALRSGQRVRLLGDAPTTLSGQPVTHAFVTRVTSEGRKGGFRVALTLQGNSASGWVVTPDLVAADPFVAGQAVRRLNRQPIAGEAVRAVTALDEDETVAIFVVQGRHGPREERVPVAALVPA